MGGNTRNLPLFATRPENVDDVFALRNDFLFGEYVSKHASVLHTPNPNLVAALPPLSAVSARTNT